MNMKKFLRGLFVMIAGIAFLVDSGCTLRLSFEHVLTVEWSGEISGYPSEGEHVFETGVPWNHHRHRGERKWDRLEYSYSPASGYENLRVLLDGDEVPPRGVILMDRDHILQVTSAPVSQE